MPRLFLAVELPPAARAQLTALLGGFSGPRWARPEHLHATLRFLGSVPDPEVPDLRRRLQTVTAPAVERLVVRGLGTFPERPSRRSPPRVLWAGLAPVDPLTAIKLAIDAVLGPDPEAADRGFHPHVTLARLKQAPGPELAPFLAQHTQLVSDPFPITDFHLYESRTLPEGAVYSRIETFPLIRDPDRVPRPPR